MVGSVMLYDPSAPARQVRAPVPKMLSGLGGIVVGFIDNAKPNFNHLVDDLGELLMTRYGVVRMLKRRKSAASVPASDEVYRELAEQCDLVITGSGD